MITAGILLLIYGFIWVILLPIRFLPDATLPAGIATAVSSIGGYLGAIDNFFPLSTLLAVLGTIISVEGAIMLYKLTMWAIRKIPGVG